MPQSHHETNQIRKAWWAARRLKYNIGLIVAGFLAFIAYTIVGIQLIEPIEHDFEINLFDVIPQGIAYGIMMLIANACYGLGYELDKTFNTHNTDAYRKRLFNRGFWFSVALPFLIPLILVIRYWPS
jgi:hypothetical protein